MKKQGFTLIELLIVVAIIAILAAIAVPNFLEAQVRAKVSAAKSDTKTLVTALESYAVDSAGKYPNGEAVTSLEFFGSPDPQVTRSPILGLTTPIAYLTTLPARNPFGKWRTPFHKKDYLGYLYEGGTFWQNDASIAWGPKKLDLFPASYARTPYLIISIGPSKVYSAGITSGVPRAVPYDPTNGTVSIGDIMYIAGSGQGGGWHSFK